MASARTCEVCGKKRKVYVIGTYKHETGSDIYRLRYKYYRRRLECANCGDRFTTYEIDQRDLYALVHRGKKTEEALVKMDIALKRAEEELKSSRELIKQLKSEIEHDYQSRSSKV